MRRSFAHIWGPVVMGAYMVFAVVATLLLTPSCVAEVEGPTSMYSAVQYFSRVFLAGLVLLMGFAALGLVLAVAAGSFVDWVSREIRAWRRARRTE